MKDFYVLLNAMVKLRGKAGLGEAPAPNALIADARLLTKRHPEAAVAVLEPLARLHPDRPDVRLALATSHGDQGTLQDALDHAFAALETAPGSLAVHYHLGRLARRTDDASALLPRYRAALHLDALLGPEAAAATTDAESLGDALERAAPPHDASARWLSLRVGVDVFQDRLDRAIARLEQALHESGRHEHIIRDLLSQAYELTDDAPHAALHRGHALYVQGHLGARDPFRTALLRGVLDQKGYRRYASACAQQLRFDDAIAVSRRGLVTYPSDDDLWYYLLYALIQTGRVEDARRTAAHGLRTGAHGSALLLHRVLHLALPVLPASSEQIAEARRRFYEGVDTLRAIAEDNDPEAGLAMMQFNNFYLAYHGEDDRALQERYGALVHESVSRRFPQWMTPLPTPPRDRPLRVGFASPVMFNHTVSRFFLGWLQHRTPGAYEAYAYHLGDKADVITNLFAHAADAFRGPLNEDIERIARTIRKDELDVLVYLDIGQTATSLTLGALRLAPVQAAAWGHPVTTGLPNMDYFISSELTEPPDADAHYSETLVRLPGIGIATPRPRLFAPPPTRREFGLPEDATVYLTPQSLYKYMPQFDGVYPAIARRDPKALFVFFEHDDANLTTQFYRRLQRAFDDAGVAMHRHVLLLPRRQLFGYLEAHALADIFLDNPTWSGGMTALDALGMGLPIVTLTGPFMRSRQSTAYLTQIGLTQLIARDEPTFVDIAVRLGTDRAFREEMSREITARQNALFDCTDCISGLEAFFVRAKERSAPS